MPSPPHYLPPMASRVQGEFGVANPKNFCEEFDARVNRASEEISGDSGVEVKHIYFFYLPYRGPSKNNLGDMQNRNPDQ